jgi:hypothetical protein
VIIRRSVGKKVVIESVLYVSGMKWNLLSIGQLVEKGFTMKIGRDSLKLFDADKKLERWVQVCQITEPTSALFLLERWCVCQALRKMMLIGYGTRVLELVKCVWRESKVDHHLYLIYLWDLAFH